MKQYGIDRFEGDIAVLVDGEGIAVSVSRAILPSGACEGDIVSFDGEKYSLDNQTTAEKRAEAKALIDELFT